ncbi:hypothetical protein MsAg5_13080 [Methanosarcinaceae archaeon Ag5]|uniref:Uncharacterized protein n=1 Tax=Methanolapillus africanus TaxID=3028297 RepID=A0AAE4MKQ5_9EURY|nr:hypothetical protein [Methanosarcinaceae archaeon Ag5]
MIPKDHRELVFENGKSFLFKKFNFKRDNDLKGIDARGFVWGDAPQNTIDILVEGNKETLDEIYNLVIVDLVPYKIEGREWFPLSAEIITERSVIEIHSIQSAIILE